MDLRDKIKLHFDDKFFQEEVRCDYTVSEKLKKNMGSRTGFVE